MVDHGKSDSNGWLMMVIMGYPEIAGNPLGKRLLPAHALAGYHEKGGCNHRFRGGSVNFHHGNAESPNSVEAKNWEKNII